MCSFSFLLAGAFFLGCICGLRSMTGPALLCWAAVAGWLNVTHTPMVFLSFRSVLVIATLLAIFEMVIDKAPGTLSRVDTGPLFVRFLSGAFCGTALGISCHVTVFFPLLFGGFGALIGAMAGYWVRKLAIRLLHVSTLPAGLVEDLVAVAAGVWFLSHR